MNETFLLELLKKELPSPDGKVLLGIGDDCAAIELSSEQKNLILKTDATIEGIHFLATDDLSDVGWKALCRPLSDFAAMGATSQHALITVAAPSSWSGDKWKKLYQGIGRAAKKFHISIVGGETSRSPKELFISVMLSGTTSSRILSRDGGEPGDLLFVTGKLGRSLPSNRHLTFLPRLEEGQWLARQAGVHAMMDLSDGLGSDLPRLAHASKCSFEIDEKKIPCHDGATVQQAITDGEDYELLCCIDSHQAAALEKAWREKFSKLELTCIGKMLPLEADSRRLSQGYDHLLAA